MGATAQSVCPIFKQKLPIAIGTSSRPATSTASGKYLDVYYQTSHTSGDARTAYLWLKMSGVGNSGEALRAYTLVTGATTAAHGAHITGQIDTAGSVTGEICGVRATFATTTGLTLSGGTAAVLRMDTDLSSAVTGLTSASYIYMEDLNASNKLALFIKGVNLNTSMFGASTGVTTISKHLKCNIEGTDYYLPLCTGTS